MNRDEAKTYVPRKRRIVGSIPWRDTCYGCIPHDHGGLGVRAYVSEDRHVVGLCRARDCYQGFPGTLHGGMIATFLDEVLWHQTMLDDPSTIAMTAEIHVQYVAPITVEQDVRIVAEPARTEGRHIYVDGYVLREDGRVAALAQSHYISVPTDYEVRESEPERLLHPLDAIPESLCF